MAHCETLDLDRLSAGIEPEIRRAMLEGKIPSCAVALVAGDVRVIVDAVGAGRVHDTLDRRLPDTARDLGNRDQGQQIDAEPDDTEHVEAHGASPASGSSSSSGMSVRSQAPAFRIATAR